MAYEASEKVSEPRRGRAPWLAAASEDQIPLMEAGAGAPADKTAWSYVPRDRLRGSELLQESDVRAPCPQGSRLPSLPAF